MRAPKKLGVLVAGSFLALAQAQASEYGDPYKNGEPAPTGSSGGWQAPQGGSGSNSPDHSGNWPSSSDGQGPGSSGNAGAWPSPSDQGSGSSGSPSGYDGSSGTNNAPGSSGDSGDTSPWQKPSGETAPSPNSGGNGNGQSSPTCPFQSTTTVFVTVQPSKVIDPAPTSDSSGGWPTDGPSSDGSSNGAPDGSSPDGSSGSPPNGNSDGSSPDGNSNDPSSDDSDPSSSDSSSTQDPSESTPSNGPSSGDAPPYGSGDPSSSNSGPSEDPASGSPGDAPSDDAGAHSGNPATQDSGEPPVTSAFSADPASGTGDVEPFTTITIDIWGTGSDPAPSASVGPTDSSSASPYGNDGTSNANGNGGDSPAPGPEVSGSPSGDSSGPNSDDGSIPSDDSSDSTRPPSGDSFDPSSGDPNGSSGSGPEGPTNSSGSNSGTPTGNDDSGSGTPDGDSGSNAPPYASSDNGAPHETRPFVTHGKPSATGSDQNWPPPSQFTSSPSGSPPDGSGSSDAGVPADGVPYSVTITGPDGQPTVVTHPWGHDSDGDDGSFPADTYDSGVGSQSADPVSGGAEGPFITPPPSGASSDPSGSNANQGGDDASTSTCITVLGDDGKATVVEWPWINTAAPGQPGPVITSGPFSDDSGNSDGPANPGDDAVFTSVTILGDDGKPTVVNWPPPGPDDGTGSGQGPAVTATAGPDGSGSNDGGIVTDAGTLPLPGASQTCITILGTDGQPTVVDWPLTSAGDGQGSGQGPVITGAPGDTDSGDSGILTNGGTFPGPEETCVTILGSDGKPTVVDWPWTNTGGPGAPGPIVTSGPFGDGSQGDNNGPVVTSGPFGNGQDGNGGPIVDGSALPQGASVTCTSLTLLGDDGKPTVVETSWVVSPANATPGPGSGSDDDGDLTGLPDGISAQIPSPTNGAGQGAGGLSTTCFTVIGDDGQPTVIESTFLPSDDAGSFVSGPGATLIPGSDASNLPGGGPQTLSTTYTVIDSNGQPSVVVTTWVASPASNTDSPVISGADAPVSAPAGQITGVPGSPIPAIPDGGSGITTCSTYTVIGSDGLPSAVETSWIIPGDGSGAAGLPQLTSGIGAVPWSASPGGPAAPSAFTADPISGLGGLPNGQGSPEGASTTCITVMTTGADGILTPVEQTVVLPLPTAAPLPSDLTAQSSLPLTTGGVPGAPPSGPVVGSGGTGEDPSNLSGYNNGAASASDAGTVAPPNGPPFPPVITNGASDPLTAGEPTSTVTRTGTITSFIFTDPLGGSQPSGVSPPAYGDDAGGPLGDAVPPNGLPGGLPSESTLFPGPTGSSPAGYGGDANAAGTPITSTWTNAVADQTTTHLVNFPLTTLATLKARHVRRQDSPGPWLNTSEPVTEPLPPVTPLPSETPALPIPPTNGSSTEPAPNNPAPVPAVCPTGGKIGNTTVDFDTAKAGPLFNPDGDLWFSEGFVIAPPSSQSSQAFVATSGGQLVEFVPASIVPNGQAGGSDVAEIGMGVNSASPCYRFNFYGASLGCAAQAPEAWCEFEISAYRWNPATSQEEPIAVSETKRVPACPGFPQGPCALTPIELKGYTDITGILITTRVGLEARPWWGDDFRFGWTDNSCTAATCRTANAVPNRIKRETLKTALRRGVWHYTPEGMERLHDDYIWNAVH